MHLVSFLTKDATSYIPLDIQHDVILDVTMHISFYETENLIVSCNTIRLMFTLIFLSNRPDQISLVTLHTIKDMFGNVKLV